MVPLIPERNYRIEYVEKKASYAMPSMDVYEDYYGIGLLLTGDRIIHSLNGCYDVHSGDLVFIHKHLYHKTASLSDIPYCDYRLRFNQTAADRIIENIGSNTFNDIFSAVSIKIPAAIYPVLVHMMKQMLDEYNRFDKYSNCVLDGMLLHFLVTLIRSIDEECNEKSRRHNHSEIVNEALKYIKFNFASSPSLTDTANALHISSGYLSKLFIVNTGTPYSRYLTNEKINHGKRLLVNTSLSITQIAYQCGFNNSNYFCDVFKRIVGISPLQYRTKRTSPLPTFPPPQALRDLLRFARQMRAAVSSLFPHASVRILPGRTFYGIGNSEKFPIP